MWSSLSIVHSSEVRMRIKTKTKTNSKWNQPVSLKGLIRMFCVLAYAGDSSGCSSRRLAVVAPWLEFSIFSCAKREREKVKGNLKLSMCISSGRRMRSRSLHHASVRLFLSFACDVAAAIDLWETAISLHTHSHQLAEHQEYVQSLFSLFTVCD